MINTTNEVKCPLLWIFWIYNFSRRILEKVFVGSIVNIRNECLFFLDSWGMNRSAEQTNRSRTALRFTRFVCPALRFIPHEPRKKDTHSLNTLYIWYHSDGCSATVKTYNSKRGLLEVKYWRTATFEWKCWCLFRLIQVVDLNYILPCLFLTNIWLCRTCIIILV